MSKKETIVRYLYWFCQECGKGAIVGTELTDDDRKDSGGYSKEIETVIASHKRKSPECSNEEPHPIESVTIHYYDGEHCPRCLQSNITLCDHCDHAMCEDCEWCGTGYELLSGVWFRAPGRRFRTKREAEEDWKKDYDTETAGGPITWDDEA